MAKRQAPGKANDNPGAEPRRDRHNAPQPPDAVGGPDDKKTPVAESGDLDHKVRVEASGGPVVQLAGESASLSGLVLVHQGAALLQGRKNIVFDVHAYNAWLPETQPKIEARIKAVQDAGAMVVLVLSILDRGEGAADLYAKAGIPFKSLFRAEEFLAVA